MLEQCGVKLDAMGNVKADSTRRTSVPKAFTAGDMARGQSLIVWAIAEGRHGARGIDSLPFQEASSCLRANDSTKCRSSGVRSTALAMRWTACTAVICPQLS
jgi:hypothetical protein